MRGTEERGASLEVLDVPSATHERILRVLALTRRPLLPRELLCALGLLTHEADEACQWLMARGYISSTTAREERPNESQAAPWNLSRRGWLWVKAHQADTWPAQQR